MLPSAGCEITLTVAISICHWAVNAPFLFQHVRILRTNANIANAIVIAQHSQSNFMGTNVLSIWQAGRQSGVYTTWHMYETLLRWWQSQQAKKVPAVKQTAISCHTHQNLHVSAPPWMNVLMHLPQAPTNSSSLSETLLNVFRLSPLILLSSWPLSCREVLLMN